VVRTPNHEDAIVVLQSIDLVKEIAPDAIGDYRVEVLEDQIARGELPSFPKYLL
jgi:hypothetical protein